VAPADLRMSIVMRDGRGGGGDDDDGGSARIPVPKDFGHLSSRLSVPLVANFFEITVTAGLQIAERDNSLHAALSFRVTKRWHHIPSKSSIDSSSLALCASLLGTPCMDLYAWLGGISSKESCQTCTKHPCWSCRLV
jgi:hypothetical protein